MAFFLVIFYFMAAFFRVTFSVFLNLLMAAGLRIAAYISMGLAAAFTMAVFIAFK
jgi:hypothetical protein